MRSWKFDLWKLLPNPVMTGWAHSLVVFLGRYLLGDPLSAEIFSYSRKKGLKEYWALSKEKHDLVKDFYNEVRF